MLGEENTANCLWNPWLTNHKLSKELVYFSNPMCSKPFQ